MALKDSLVGEYSGTDYQLGLKSKLRLMCEGGIINS